MGLSISGATMGNALWGIVNTGLGAAGTALGATALGSKCSEQKVREIIREEAGLGYGFAGRGGSVTDTVVVQQPCSHNTLVNRFEMEQSQRISELESTRDTDAKLLDVYKAASAETEKVNAKFNQLTRELTDYVIANNRVVDEIRCDSRVNHQQIVDNLAFVNDKIDRNQKEMYAYVDCKTLPLEKKISLNSVCPKPLAANAPVAIQGQVIVPTPTGETTTVVSAAKAVAK